MGEEERETRGSRGFPRLFPRGEGLIWSPLHELLENDFDRRHGFSFKFRFIEEVRAI
jgi:hypothetical protein